eukprot:m.81055 g.81055  ORF g.81055 m.81055 type:complete len:57 (-) comp12621_c0_seq8:2349-2519(-)
MSYEILPSHWSSTVHSSYQRLDLLPGVTSHTQLALSFFLTPGLQCSARSVIQAPQT